MEHSSHCAFWKKASFVALAVLPEAVAAWALIEYEFDGVSALCLSVLAVAASFVFLKAAKAV
jgi:hypothetical protein